MDAVNSIETTVVQEAKYNQILPDRKPNAKTHTLDSKKGGIPCLEVDNAISQKVHFLNKKN
jgi:hypothetical protein